MGVAYPGRERDGGGAGHKAGFVLGLSVSWVEMLTEDL